MDVAASEGSTLPPDEKHITGGVLAIVRELAAELHPGTPGQRQLGVDSSIERDFGLDSLARVELAMRIEHAFATTIPDTAIAESETVRDLAHAVAGAHGTAMPAPAPAPRAPAQPAMAPAPGSVATLVDALEWHVRAQPDRMHILIADNGSGSPLTFGELRREAVSVAADLRRRGIGVGDTVAIMLPTGREFFAAFYGAMYARAVPVPIYPPTRAAQIEPHMRRVAGVLGNCEARVLLTSERARRFAQPLLTSGTRLQSVVALPEPAALPPEWTAPSLNPADTAFLQYTSGSTGRPKGVVLSHANVLANLEAMRRVTLVGSGDCFVSWLPLYHDMGLIGACFGALVYGFPLVLMSPFSFLSHPVHWLRTIERHRATITAAPNFAFELCLNKIQDQDLEHLDLSALRLAFNGAEAVSARTLERFARRFAPCGLRPEALMPVYGLAECALGLTFPPSGRVPRIDRITRERFLESGIANPAPPDDPAALNIVSCGAPLPGHSVRIVDPGGATVPGRTQGRIQFMGPSATSGYFNNPDETARLFDGAWLDTGDLGYLADGELYVTGRAKDIIIRGGHNIHPQELEQAVDQLPGVRKGCVAVFPASDPSSGTERLIVLVEVRDDRAVSRPGLVADVNRLAVDLMGVPVDEVILAPPHTVLKTSSGKVRRSACREAYERGELIARAGGPPLARAGLTVRAAAAHAARLTRRAVAAGWGLRALFVGAVIAPVSLLSVMLAPGLRRRRRFCAAFARTALRLCGMTPRIRRAGPVGRPSVYVANHASYLDGLLLLAALPFDVAFVAKREFIDQPLIGRALRAIGCVFVERQDRLEAAASARELEARLRAGESLVVFPEGTFHRAAGLLPFHLGAFLAAAAAAATVVPVAIRGSRAMLPEGAVLPRPGTVDVIIGSPLAPTGAGWRSAVALRSGARRHILREVVEADLETPPPRPAS